MSRNDPDPDGVTHDPSDDSDPSESVFSYPGVSWGWVPSLKRGRAPELDEEREEETPPYDQEDEEWLSEGVIGLVLLAGAVLFLIPEPITSTLGVILLVGGILAWVAEALR